VSAPASVAAGVRVRFGAELRLTARRSENLLAMLVIPIAVLVFFVSLGIPADAGDPVAFLLPGVLALAIVASGLVNLGIATAYERQYGVLKRLGGSPLTGGQLVVAKLASVLAFEVVQVVLLIAIAAGVLGWAPPGTPNPVLLVVAIVLGTAAFAGLGLLLAGTLRAEATLALANGLFLAVLLLGGVVQPLERLPEPLATLAGLLPGAALADTFRVALGSAPAAGGPAEILVLAVWAALLPIAAARTFRWE
jgi:ABC-2 type transport system permease protein